MGTSSVARVVHCLVRNGRLGSCCCCRYCWVCHAAGSMRDLAVCMRGVVLRLYADGAGWGVSVGIVCASFGVSSSTQPMRIACRMVVALCFFLCRCGLLPVRWAAAPARAAYVVVLSHVDALWFLAVVLECLRFQVLAGLSKIGTPCRYSCLALATCLCAWLGALFAGGVSRSRCIQLRS